MKMKIVRTDAHDHTIVYLDDELVISNDYGVENLYRVAEHLGWEVERVTLDENEFERLYS